MLLEKIHGCNAAVNVSNSMGDITEGLGYPEIQRRFGFVDRLLPQDKEGSVTPRPWGPAWVRHAHHRPAGMGEDGLERHRLMCTAVIEKGGRVDIWDLARVWLRDIEAGKFGYLLGNQRTGSSTIFFRPAFRPCWRANTRSGPARSARPR